MVLRDEHDGIIIKTYHSMLSPQRREYREHHHTECELSFFISGSGVYSVRGKQYDFSEGDVFIFGSNEAHCITDIYEDMDLLNIHFEPRLLWEHTENTELLSLFAARCKNFSNRFSDDDGVLRRGIMILEKELTDKDICCAVSAKCVLFFLLIHMIRTYDCVEADKILVPQYSVTKSLKKSIQYINDNLSEKLTLKQLSEVACMTPTYFSSVFKKFNGVSPWKYITIKRVERAIEMLKSTDMTKLEIAQRCGFSSSSNFYKAFVSVTGKKPNDYSKNNVSQNDTYSVEKKQ
jgi:AraC-like DNA-binding protein